VRSVATACSGGRRTSGGQATCLGSHGLAPVMPCKRLRLVVTVLGWVSTLGMSAWQLFLCRLLHTFTSHRRRLAERVGDKHVCYPSGAAPQGTDAPHTRVTNAMYGETPRDNFRGDAARCAFWFVTAAPSRALWAEKLCIFYFIRTRAGGLFAAL